MNHQVMWYLGLTSATGWPYLLWSGAGGVIRDLIPWSLLALMWKRHLDHTRDHFHVSIAR